MKKMRPMGLIQFSSFQRKHHAGLNQVLSNFVEILEISQIHLLIF